MLIRKSGFKITAAADELIDYGNQRFSRKVFLVLMAMFIFSWRYFPDKST
jgi:hypothetical protein